MSRREENPIKVDADRKKLVGHYKAYGSDGTLLWEKKDFEIGTDKAPPGVAAAMVSMAVTDPKGNVLRKWGPWANR